VPINPAGLSVRKGHMILLKKINNAPIALNSDLIEYIEETPDTVITLTNNDRVVVQEGLTEIIEKVVRYRRLISGMTDAESERVLRSCRPSGRVAGAE